MTLHTIPDAVIQGNPRVAASLIMHLSRDSWKRKKTAAWIAYTNAINLIEGELLANYEYAKSIYPAMRLTKQMAKRVEKR